MSHETHVLFKTKHDTLLRMTNGGLSSYSDGQHLSVKSQRACPVSRMPGMDRALEASDVLCLETKDGGKASLLHLAGVEGPIVLVLPANGFHVKCYSTLVRGYWR